MTKKTDTKTVKLMSPELAAIYALGKRGREYTAAYIAGIAHELVVRMEGDKLPRGVAQQIADATGHAKADVSRIVKTLKTNSRARTAARKLDVLTIDDTPDTLAAAAKVGDMFARAKKTASAGTSTTRARDDAETEAENLDELVTVKLTEWLTTATDSQFEARAALVQDIIAQIAAERGIAA